ncbi:hypothetical protein K504DRAFT_494358 [Pleomassaria siparia CBS 279.74]|uniref:Uncharacterized protein n=1 Tax=Pleomassaria siparia CBS 279.74 TaxID=1314801 RepID=A0A6G1JWP6_9PLEO|nr:hypothetical protein K504DRAFT_494358 [Pleomassaria siparia CBS 279.74]
MANGTPNKFNVYGPNGPPSMPHIQRIQIPGLFINDALVDGELYIQWTPASNSIRPQTSTVFIVAGPNAQRPGIRSNDGISNPHAQVLTEAQAEGFTPVSPQLKITAPAVQTASDKKKSSTKLYKKKTVPKAGYKRKSVAFVQDDEDDEPQSTIIPRKRSRLTSEVDDEGVDDIVQLPTANNPVTTTPLNGTQNGTVKDLEVNGVTEKSADAAHEASVETEGPRRRSLASSPPRERRMSRRVTQRQ